MNKLKIAIGCTALALVFASCRSSSTSPNSSGGIALTAAKPGSSFHFVVMETDTNGNLLGSQYNQTDSIIATGINWAGKSNVIMDSVWDNLENAHVDYYALLDNGDVEIYLGPLSKGIVAEWITWPFGSVTPVSTALKDLTTTIVGDTQRVTDVATYSTGPDSIITVQDSNLTLKQVIGNYVTTQTISITNLPTQTKTSVLQPFHFYWSPKIGFVAGARFNTGDAGGYYGMFNPPSILTLTLISYTLK